MKKVVLAVLMAIGMLGVPAYAQQRGEQEKKIDAKCAYKLADAREGLKDFVVVGFEPRKTSPDGNRTLGLMFFHDPKSAKAESIDAAALVLVDKAAGKELTFVVAYAGPVKTVVYERDTKDGKVGPCFEKTVKDTPKTSK